MHYALDLPTAGPYADLRLLGRLAQAAEAAGWDGVFVYDQVATDDGEPLADPWLALTAIALHTQRIRFGALVTPLARRRPWKVAREAVSLDQLSGGRMVLGVGLGSGPAEFDNLGEAADPKVRAALLDEGLQIIDGLWRGKPFSFTGAHFRLQDAHFLPTPVQTPRIPIWVGGVWPNRAPFRRAARWDGVFPHFQGGMIPADELRAVVDFVRSQRQDAAPFDVVIRNKLPAFDPAAEPAAIAAYAAAGLTWWLEGVERAPTLEQMWALIHRGPPRWT